MQGEIQKFLKRKQGHHRILTNCKLAMSKKRRREQPSVNNQLIEIYEDLANERDEVRLKAALTLLSTTSKDANPSSEHIEKVFNRLIRGLCSGRKAARLGFSVAFTELLAQQWSSGAERVDGFNWGISEIIQLLDEQTQVGGSVSGQVGLICQV